MSFWGICDIKYDPRCPVGQRVRILELGDGRSSRFSHHGRYLVEELSGVLVFPLDINYLNMLSWPWPRMLAVLGMIVGLKSSSNIGWEKIKEGSLIAPSLGIVC